MPNAGPLQASALAVTANVDGSGVAQVPAGASFVVVTSGDVVLRVTLPTAVMGNVVSLFAPGTGFRLQSAAPSAVAINGGQGLGAAADVASGMLVRCTCVGINWLCSQTAADGSSTPLPPAWV